VTPSFEADQRMNDCTRRISRSHGPSGEVVPPIPRITTGPAHARHSQTFSIGIPRSCRPPPNPLAEHIAITPGPVRPARLSSIRSERA